MQSSNTAQPRVRSMNPEKQREIARKGGKAAHEKGTAHEFTTDEALAAGRKGGERVSGDRSHMSAHRTPGREKFGHPPIHQIVTRRRRRSRERRLAGQRSHRHGRRQRIAAGFQRADDRRRSISLQDRNLRG